jgi:hypothetical protein
LATEQVPLLFGKGLERYRDDFIVDTFEGGLTKEHGRIESRTATVIRLDALNPSGVERAKLANPLEWLPKAERWPAIRSVIRVVRRYESTSGKDDPTTAVRYFISSLALSAEKLMEISIGHWTVETRHSTLDGAQAEDECEDECEVYRGNAPEVLSILRKLVGNLIYIQTKLHNESTKSVMKMMHLCPDYLKAILTLHPKKVGSTEAWRQAMGATRRAIVVPKLAAD